MILLILSLVFAAVLASIFNIGLSPGDLLSFWAAGRVALAGGNPYDLNLVTAEIVNFDPSLVKLMPVYNPPWAFSLIILMGLIPFSLLGNVWFVLSLGLIVYCFFLITDRPNLYSYLVLFSFSPIYVALYLGQLVPVILLFLVLAYVFFQNNRPILGSLALAGTLIKPHLFILTYLFWLRVYHRNPLAIATFLGTFLAISIVPIFFVPDIYGFFLAKASVIPTEWKNPVLGAWLIELSGVHWARFLPCLVGVTSIVFLSPKIFSREFFVISVTLSLIASPYAWTYDYIILLPCLFLFNNPSIIALNLLLFCMPNDMWFDAWYPLAILVISIIIWRNRLKPCSNIDPHSTVL